MSLPVHRCLIVDDSVAFRAAVRDMLESAGMVVVATVSSLASAVEATARYRPDVVLVDIDLGGESGFDIVEALQDVDVPRRPATILVSTHEQDDFAEMIEASSAIGFLQKFGLSAERVAEVVAGRPDA
jgi:DNA-binding NarL/FixJ family response regulator